MDNRSSTFQIIGRTSERKLLEEIANSNDPELVAVYGRRRVGKTFLIREQLRNRMLFELTGLHGEPLSRQLANFATAFRRAFPKAASIVPNSWLVAFEMLEQATQSIPAKSQKKVLFFDEFPWMATRKSGFLAAFEGFWNSFASRRRDLIVVICGSAAAWMIRKVIQARGGLHNRVTRRIRLEPFDLSETRDYLQHRRIRYDNLQLAQLYMSIGGIPHYLNLILPGRSVTQNIDQLCFQKDGLLNQEYPHLYAALFEDYSTHEAIVKALASQWQGLNREELLQKTKLTSGGGVSSAIEELVQSGFVAAIEPRGNIAKETVYRLSDEYTLFYWHWIRGNRTAGNDVWIRKATGRRYESWCGYAFESLCFKHIHQIKAALGISGVETTVSTWRHASKLPNEEGAQIDLVIDRRDACINLCEMKFSLQPFVIDKPYAAELERKIRVFQGRTKTQSTVFLTMITASGLKQNDYAMRLVPSTIAIDDLIKPK